jgi:hypothetical protein
MKALARSLSQYTMASDMSALLNWSLSKELALGWNPNGAAASISRMRLRNASLMSSKIQVS